MIHLSQSYGMDETIIWYDAMNSSNTNNNWQTYGQLSSPTPSPLNSSELCWSIVHTNAAPNPYIYRVTDLSSLIIPRNEKLTINYDILPWHLSPNMRCQVVYTTMNKHIIDSNAKWQLLAQYNHTKNSIKLSSQSYEIPIIDIDNKIVITFMLSTYDTSDANVINLEEYNACYLSNIALKLETSDIDTIIDSKINSNHMHIEPTKMTTGGYTPMDVLLVCSFGLLISILCSIFVVGLCGCFCLCRIRKEAERTWELRAEEERLRASSNTNTKTCTGTKLTNTSLQIGRITPYIEQFPVMNTPTSINKPYFIEPSVDNYNDVCTDRKLYKHQQNIMTNPGNRPNFGSLNQNNLKCIADAYLWQKKHRPSSLEVQMDEQISFN